MSKITYQKALDIFNTQIKDLVLDMRNRDNAGAILEQEFEKITNRKCSKGATADLGDVEIKATKEVEHEEGRRITLAGMSIYDAKSRNKIIKNALNGRRDLMFSSTKKHTSANLNYYLTIDKKNKRILFHIEMPDGKNKLDKDIFIEFEKIQERIKNKLNTILVANYDFVDETRKDVVFTKAIIVSYTLDSFLQDIQEGKITFEMRTRGKSLSFVAKTRSIYIVDHIICS